MTDHFVEHFKVRDYECDLQGIVNNAVYQNYLEHTRHEFLLHRGIDFAEQTRAGIHLVVIRAELDYKASLGSGDRFRVTLNVSLKDRLRFVFDQSIHRDSDHRLCLAARITATALNERGRPFHSPDLIRRLIPTDDDCR